MRSFLLRALVFAGAVATVFSSAANSLTWRNDRIDADIRLMDLPALLEQIAGSTGWQVYLEPGTTGEVSAKFKDLPPGEALRLLLGNLNFALVPQEDSASRLYVFRTSRLKATQIIQPARPGNRKKNASLIPNQLIVRLKPGGNIEGLARRLGAKITGRIDALNTYLLEFADEASAQAARDLLANDPEVAAVDSNFSVDRPPPEQTPADSLHPEWNLKPKDSTGPCQITIGLIDTAVGTGNGLDPFLLSPISVAGPSSSQPSDLTHGMAMAQAIMQSIQTNVVGNSTSVKILPVDVYGPNSTTTTFNVGQGIYQAVNAGANIINMSLGGSGDSAFVHGLIMSASQQGIVFFGAAGNQPVTTPTYPAAYPEVIAVTASGPDGQIANYANRGSFVSIMEPGTSLADFQGQPYIVTGTSSATALASGFAAGLADSTQSCPDQVVSTIRSKLAVNFNPGP